LTFDVLRKAIIIVLVLISLDISALLYIEANSSQFTTRVVLL